jgi:hypothetical protein
MQTLPMVIDLPNGKKCAMITNLDSRLYIQSAGSEVNYNLIGGENNNFNVKGVNYEKGRMRDNGLPFTFEFNCEEGWGRIEITPKKPAKTDCMLTVMYLAPDVDYAPKLVFGDSNVLPFRELVEIKGEDILDKVIYCENYNEVANTNIQKVFELILHTAKINNIPQEELPKRLYIISDMEFDYCAKGASLTNFEYAKKLFEDAGYKLPEVVFWNVASRNRQQPVTKNEQGVLLVSGCTPRLFKMMTDGKLSESTPYEFMMEVLTSERYEKIAA